jgi:hypothetical protein
MLHSSIQYISPSALAIKAETAAIRLLWTIRCSYEITVLLAPVSDGRNSLTTTDISRTNLKVGEHEERRSRRSHIFADASRRDFQTLLARATSTPLSSFMDAVARMPPLPTCSTKNTSIPQLPGALSGRRYSTSIRLVRRAIPYLGSPVWSCSLVQLLLSLNSGLIFGLQAKPIASSNNVLIAPPCTVEG